MATFKPSNQSRNFDYPMPYQGKMAKSALYNIENNARNLRQQLRDGDAIPQWNHYKIATADKDLTMVNNYLSYKIMDYYQQGGTAIDIAMSQISCDLTSEDPVTKMAAIYLRALLQNDANATMASIDYMIAQLRKASRRPQEAAQNAATLAVYVRMKQMWQNALNSATK